MEASVILPTFNRCDTLARVLASLETQQRQETRPVEIVVADDGSTDDTNAVLARHAAAGGPAFRHVVLPRNRGPAGARNEALRLATGRIVILVGDDIVPPSGFLARHLNWHAAHPAETDAVLGKVTWPASPSPTSFMKWLEGDGRMFYMNFKDMPTDRPIDAACFYTCNVSLKRSVCQRAGGLDESFPYASHEDLEWGIRLGAAGMRLFHDPSILAEHWHTLDLPGMARRVYRMGYSAKIFWEKVPDRAQGLRKAMREMLVRWNRVPLSGAFLEWLVQRPGHAGQHRPLYWKLVLSLCYSAGLSDARTGQSPREFPR